MNIQELRKQYPQYNDLSDQDLATGFHKKFYSDLPFEDFAGRIGLGVAPAAPTAPAPKVEEAPVAPATSEEVAITQPEPTIPTDEGFFARNYRYAKDALLSGFENIRANTKGEALAIARGSMLSYEKQYGGPGIPLAPPNVKKEYEKLIEEYKWNELVYKAKFSFEPVIGKVYHLYYNKEGNIFLSLISPSEWKLEHIGSFKYNHDNKWIKIN